MNLFFLFAFSVATASEIAVVSMAVGGKYKAATSIGIENKRSYCEMHGYDFICEEDWLDPSRPIQWSKILLLEKVLKNCDYKWIFWTDADSLFMNLSIRLEDLVDSEYNLIISNDYNGINTGEFLIKNCPWSAQLLSGIYAHVECINHPWWEQQALRIEIEQCPELLSSIKIVPQRLFNSFPPEIAGNQFTALYQTGDFILHFAGIKNLDRLEALFDKYSKEVVSLSACSNLDQYLKKSGFFLSPADSKTNEGYMTESQKKQFVGWLKEHPHIQTIAEIGLNSGHSAENFFLNIPELKQFISFDIQHHEYTKIAREYLEREYPGRFFFIQGDSAITVPEFAKSTNAVCDLIYIDGNHSYEGAIQDLINCRKLAHENTVLWIDDYNGPSVRRAIFECHREKIIKIVDIHWTSDPCGERAWVEARYCL